MNPRNKLSLPGDSCGVVRDVGDDFDELLEQSSLGTRAAKQNQVQTPAEAYERLEEHLRNGKPDCRGDVDDFLLHMVRWYSAARDAEGPTTAWVNLALGAELLVFKRGFRWRFTSSGVQPDVVPRLDFAMVICVFELTSDAVPKIVRRLHDRDVFSCLRQDVARDMVDICFSSSRPLPRVITAACATAVPASSVRDELVVYFSDLLRPFPPERALPTGSWCHRTAIRPASSTPTDLIVHPNIWTSGPPSFGGRSGSHASRRPVRLRRASVQAEKHRGPARTNVLNNFAEGILAIQRLGMMCVTVLASVPMIIAVAALIW